METESDRKDDGQKTDKKKVRMPKSRFWFVTINPKDDEPAPEPIFDEYTLHYMEIVKHKAPTTGTLHWHGILHFKTQKTGGEVSMFLDWTFGDWKPIINRKGAETYLNDGHSTVEGPYRYGNPTMRMGYRSDWEQVDALAKQGAGLKAILDNNPRLIREDKAIIRHIARLTQPFRGVRYAVIMWGAADMGKSERFFTKYGDDNIFVLKRSNFPFDGYSGEENILIEDVKPGDSLDDLKEYISTTQKQLNIKGGWFPAAYKRVLITSNFNPDGWWPTAADRSKFFKRINRVIHLETADQYDEDFPRIEREFEIIKA